MVLPHYSLPVVLPRIALAMVEKVGKRFGRSIRRAPFRLRAIIWASDFVRLQIVGPNPGFLDLDRVELGKGPNLPCVGMPEDMVDFIQAHCKCVFCGASVGLDLSRCACGKSRGFHLEVVFPASLYYSGFKPIFDRESSRLKSLVRNRRIATNGGKASVQDIRTLYTLQEGLCYYCGTSIEGESWQNPFEVDHYESVHDGGSNDITNLVLACPTCNRRKGDNHGDFFQMHVWRSLTPEVRRKLRKIRKQIDDFFETKNLTAPASSDSN